MRTDKKYSLCLQTLFILINPYENLIIPYKMSNNILDFCKLCCASRNLINMFTGKCRSFRNILLKIIKEALGIEVSGNRY